MTLSNTPRTAMRHARPGPAPRRSGGFVNGLLVALLACTATALNGAVGIVDGQAETAERVYVANQASASVSVIDAASGTVIETIDLTRLGFDPNCRPHHTAVDPDGSHWYVSLIGGGNVLRFNADNELVSRAPFETPGLLSVDPTSDRLYVGRSMMAVNPPQRIGEIDRNDMTVQELDVFFPRPHALTIDPSTNRIFTASLVENRVAVVESGTEALELVDIDGPPHTLVQFALSPDGRHLVATTQLTGRLLVFDATTPQLRLVSEVEVGTQPWHPVFSPSGDRVYFGAKDDDAVVVVETDGWSVVTRITAPGIVEPHGSAVTADGRYLFVSNRNLKGAYTPTRQVEDNADVGTVVKIDTRTLEVVQTIEVGTYPAGISLGAVSTSSPTGSPQGPALP
ncbi:MAG: beta-propeller fold lactonase family protein [Gemmatimonadota bacterium]|nr:beta-propeller fold lactonase family protein [Gemmatimonadota bacterium]